MLQKGSFWEVLLAGLAGLAQALPLLRRSEKLAAFHPSLPFPLEGGGSARMPKAQPRVGGAPSSTHPPVVAGRPLPARNPGARNAAEEARRPPGCSSATPPAAERYWPSCATWPGSAGAVAGLGRLPPGGMGKKKAAAAAGLGRALLRDRSHARGGRRAAANAGWVSGRAGPGGLRGAAWLRRPGGSSRASARA